MSLASLLLITILHCSLGESVIDEKLDALEPADQVVAEIEYDTPLTPPRRPFSSCPVANSAYR